jgi:hypothetical protein
MGKTFFLKKRRRGRKSVLSALTKKRLDYSGKGATLPMARAKKGSAEN